jgi:hypothetical protein
MPSPRAPIVLLEGGSWQGIYGSLDELVGDIEGYDVRAGDLTVLDADGLIIRLSTEANWGAPIVADVSDENRKNELERALRALVADNSVQWGLIDSDVNLDALLLAIWRREHPDAPYPK